MNAPATTAPASHSQRAYRERRARRHHSEIKHERPWTGLLRLNQQRDHERAREAEPRQRRPVQGRCKHGRNADRAERNKSDAWADELVERVRRVDRAERADRTGAGQDAGNVRCRDRCNRRGPLRPPEPLATATALAKRCASAMRAPGPKRRIDGVQPAKCRRAQELAPPADQRVPPLLRLCPAARPGCVMVHRAGSSRGLRRRSEVGSGLSIGDSGEIAASGLPRRRRCGRLPNGARVARERALPGGCQFDLQAG